MMALVLGILMSLAVNVVSAQVATPVGEVVPPEECTTQPRPARFLADLIATPMAQPQESPLADLPEGTEPDAQTREEVTAHLRQIVACTNTGEYLRALALYSDDYLRQAVKAAGLSEQGAIEAIAPLATPMALTPDLYVRIVGFPLMDVLEDGRVVAAMTTIPLGGGAETTDLFLLSRTNDSWTVDATIVQFDQLPTAATPEA